MPRGKGRFFNKAIREEIKEEVKADVHAAVRKKKNKWKNKKWHKKGAAIDVMEAAEILEEEVYAWELKNRPFLPADKHLTPG